MYVNGEFICELESVFCGWYLRVRGGRKHKDKYRKSSNMDGILKILCVKKFQSKKCFVYFNHLKGTRHDFEPDAMLTEIKITQPTEIKKTN